MKGTVYHSTCTHVADGTITVRSEDFERSLDMVTASGVREDQEEDELLRSAHIIINTNPIPKPV